MIKYNQSINQSINIMPSDKDTPIQYFLQTQQQLPVMVWIHGGGYFGGHGASDNYIPYPLMAMGEFVFVSINYRFGIYGFLTTGDKNKFALLTFQVIAERY